MRSALALLSLVLAACASSPGVAGTSPPSTTASTSTAATSSTVPPTTSSTVAVRPICDLLEEEALTLGVIDEPELAEVSGIVRSVNGPGMLWAHNDSGTPPRLWSIDSTGSVLGYVEVRARNVDWEDSSLGPGPDGEWWVYIADIGDNILRRSQVWLHRFAEPTAVGGVAAEVESVAVTYPVDPVDAEAMFVDPITGDAFIVTKVGTGRSAVLRVPVGAWSQDVIEAELVATVDLGALSFVTAADITAAGDVIALRTYGDVWLWERSEGSSIAETLRTRPCRAPSAAEAQGEAIAIDTTGYTTISEGAGAAVFRFDGLGR